MSSLRLHLETLESRINLTATFKWNGAADALWSNATSWTLQNGVDADGVPDSDDHVWFADNVGTSSVANIAKVRSITMEQSQGAILLDSDLEVTDHVTQRNGNFVSVNPQRSLVLTERQGTGCIYTYISGMLSGVKVVLGSPTIRSTIMNLDVDNTIVFQPQLLAQATIINYGTINWNKGTIEAVDATIENRSQARINLFSNSHLKNRTANSGQSKVVNSGDMTVKPSASSKFEADIFNAGNIVIDNSKLTVNGICRQNAGTFKLLNGQTDLTNSSRGPLEIVSGLITGIGKVDGNLTLGTTATHTLPIIQPCIDTTFGNIVITLSMEIFSSSAITRNKVGPNGTSTKIITEAGYARV